MERRGLIFDPCTCMHKQSVLNEILMLPSAVTIPDYHILLQHFTGLIINANNKTHARYCQDSLQEVLCMHNFWYDHISPNRVLQNNSCC